MKKITIQLATIIIILFFISGCDKYHRDRYTGTWEFETVRTFINIHPYDFEVVRTDTVYYTGKIILGNLENYLHIQYTNEDEIDVWIDKEGYISSNACPTGGKYSCGQFESKDKMHLQLLWGHLVVYNGDTDLRSDYIVGIKNERR